MLLVSYLNAGGFGSRAITKPSSISLDTHSEYMPT